MPGEVESRPRLYPVSPKTLDETQQAVLESARAPEGAAGGAMNVYSTVVRHPRLLRHWLPFGGCLMTGALEPRQRELLVLRTGWRCGSEYEWGQHALVALAAGLTRDEIRRTRGPVKASEWSPQDCLFLAVADELHDSGSISQTSWEELEEFLSEKQLIEIPMLVGHYHMVAFLLNTLQIQRDDGVPSFDF